MGESIGAVGGEPVAASAARLRTILPGLVSDASLLNRDMARWSTRLVEPHATRLTVRAVVGPTVASQLSYLEATVPLSSGRSLVYLGANLPLRRVDEDEAHRLDAIATVADRNHGPGGGPDLDKIAARLRGASAAGYEIGVATSASERAALSSAHGKEIARLLGRFGYDLDAAYAVLVEPANLVATAVFEGTAIAVVVLERATVPLETGATPLRIAELTDSSVDDDHVGAGLQLVLHAHLVAALLDREPVDLVFSESGYTASLFNAASFGRRFCGRLANHAHIGEDTDAAAPLRYQSLEVTAITGAEASALVVSLRATGALH